MTITELATNLARDKGTVSKWESAKDRSRPPERSEILRIAEVLDVQPGPILRAAGYRYAVGEEEIADDELRILTTLRGLSNDARERVEAIVRLEANQARNRRRRR